MSQEAYHKQGFFDKNLQRHPPSKEIIIISSKDIIISSKECHETWEVRVNEELRAGNISRSARRKGTGSGGVK